MSEMVERIARRLARCHFMRKQHYGVGTQEDRVNYLVDAYWRNHEADARAVISTIREYFTELSGPDFSSSELDGAIAAIDEALK